MGDVEKLAALRIKLAEKREEHRDLDDSIQALEAAAARDALQLQRLKRQKLALKDEIQRIENQILPDIIA